jgi:hypothetical protein
LSASSPDCFAATRRPVRRPFRQHQSDEEIRPRQWCASNAVDRPEPVSFTDAVAVWRVTGDPLKWQGGG